MISFDPHLQPVLTNYPAFIKALKDIGYDGWYSVEFESWNLATMISKEEAAAMSYRCAEVLINKILGKYGFVLTHTLNYAKVTKGFLQAIATLLQNIQDSPFRANKETLVLQLRSGAYRMYLFNDHHNKYHKANVTAKIPIKDAKIVTKFPILPPKFVDSFDSMEADNHIFTDDIQKVKQNFIVKIPPAGVVVLDIWPQ